ncbi:flagellar hook-associated protein FlgL [Planctomycetota bacterium]
MSGTLNNIYNNASYALALHTESLTRLQEQVSTGSRINRISDDSSTAYQVLGLESKQRSLANYIDNLEQVIAKLELSSTIIIEMSSALSEVRTQLTQIAGGIYNEDARERMAAAVNDVIEQIFSLVNTENIGQYLFGGGNTDSAPYMAERTNGDITGVAYQGSYENRKIEVAPGLESSLLQVGDEIFSSNERGQIEFFGDTGAKLGTGTSNVRGNTWLTVTGVAGNYTLSIDGGLTTFNTDGTDTNLALTNSETGEILYVDTTEIQSTGIGLVMAKGTYDIFGMLIGIRDILRNENNLPEAQLRELQNASLASLEEINNLLVQAEVTTGSKIGFLDNLNENLTNLKYNAEDENVRLQQADIAQIAIDLSRQEVLYQMSLSVAGKLMSMSLLDFIS